MRKRLIGLLFVSRAGTRGSENPAGGGRVFRRGALPSGAMQGSAGRPARPGETIVLYGVGFGPVTPNIGAGDTVKDLNSLVLPFQIYLGGMPASIRYAGLATGMVGLYQFNIVVPETATGDAVPLTFALGTSTGQQVLYTAVEK